MHGHDVILMHHITPDEPKIFSKQIDEHPSIIVTEGDDTVITCEMQTSTISLYPQWMLSGISDAPPLLIPNNQSVSLIKEMQVAVLTMDGYVYNDSHLGEVQNFSIILLNVKAAITGLTVYCGLRWEEANVTKFYEQAAVVVVISQQQSMGLHVE